MPCVGLKHDLERLYSPSFGIGGLRRVDAFHQPVSRGTRVRIAVDDQNSLRGDQEHHLCTVKFGVSAGRDSIVELPDHRLVGGELKPTDARLFCAPMQGTEMPREHCQEFEDPATSALTQCWPRTSLLRSTDALNSVGKPFDTLNSPEFAKPRRSTRRRRIRYRDER